MVNKYCEIIIIHGGLIFVDFVLQFNHEIKSQRTNCAQNEINYAQQRIYGPLYFLYEN